MRACVAVGIVLWTATGAWAQSAEDVAQLKKDVAALKANVVGLQKELAAMKTAVPVAKKPNFSARFNAATLLTSSSDQQSAFAKLSMEAAAWGETKVVYDALGKITSSSVLQDCTYKAAIKLGAIGLEDDAVTLAKRLTSSSEQQRALLKIARGETEDKP